MAKKVDRLALVTDQIGQNARFRKEYKATIHVVKDALAAMMLHYLIDFQACTAMSPNCRSDRWFYVTIERMTMDLYISYHQQKKALDKLENMGFIEIRVMGENNRRHIRLNGDQIVDMIDHWAENCDRRGCLPEGYEYEPIGKPEVMSESTSESVVKKVENRISKNSKTGPVLENQQSRLSKNSKAGFQKIQKHSETVNNETKSSENKESTKVLSATDCAVAARATSGSLTGASKSRKDRDSNSGKSLARFSEEVQAWAKTLNKILRANSASRRLPTAETIAQEIRRVQAKGILTDEQITAALAWAQENYSTNEYCRKIRAVKDVAAAVESWANQAGRKFKPKAQFQKSRLEKFEKSASASESAGENTPAGKYSGSVGGYKRSHTKRAREDHAVKARQRVQEERRPPQQLGGPIDWDEVS